MKTKLTIIIAEIADRPTPSGLVPMRLLVDQDEKFPSKYISTKNLDDTIQELLFKYTSNLDIRYCHPELADFFHEAGSTESEVVFLVKLSQGLIGTNEESSLVNINNLSIEEKYAGSIQRTPRAIQ
jgi:hypothetical protein